SQTQGLRLVRDEPFAPRHYRHVGLLGPFAGLVLVAEQAHGFVRRADELDVSLEANYAQGGVVRKQSVAGQNSMGGGDHRGAGQMSRSMCRQLSAAVGGRMQMASSASARYGAPRSASL